MRHLPDKEIKLHEGTKQALAGVLVCPICGSKEPTVIDVRLYKTDISDADGSGYRKRREIVCGCGVCLGEGRGSVIFRVSQCF